MSLMNYFQKLEFDFIECNALNRLSMLLNFKK